MVQGIHSSVRTDGSDGFDDDVVDEVGLAVAIQGMSRSEVAVATSVINRNSCLCSIDCSKL